MCQCVKTKSEKKNGETTQFAFSTAVCRFHVYRTVWTPHIGQCLRVEKEHKNIKDRFSIATILVGIVGIVIQCTS